MNLTIEELKNEDGQYKLRKLSDNVIFIKYKIPIFASNNNLIILTSTLDVKIRFRKNKNINSDIYNMIHFKEKFVQKLSQKWVVKKGRILFQRKSGLFKIEDYLINGLYCGVIIDDASWYRNYKIDKLLENEK